MAVSQSPAIIQQLGLAAVDDWLRSLTPVKTEDLIGFIIQLSNMVGAGISLPNALHILFDQTENPKLKETVHGLIAAIETGSTFSEALERHPKIFSHLFINMVRAGETSGNLEEVLMRLAKFAEADAQLKQRVTTAMVYPAVLFVVGGGVILFIIVFLLPMFIKIYSEMSINLPLPTRILIATSNFMSAYGLFVFVGAAAGIAAFIWGLRTPRGKYLADKVILKVPVLGGMIQKTIIARLARTLGTLIGSGVPMLVALETTRGTVGNEVMAEVLIQVENGVQKGEQISGPLKSSGLFPPMVVQMVAVGEESGALETMFHKIADYYDMVSDQALKRVLSLMEPVFLVVIGGAVGMIFAAIIMPIFEMAKTLGH